jgi:hypothetical protein
MNKQVKLLIERHFGPDARIERKLFGGYRIIAPFGEVEIKDDGFENIVGDGDMYQATLLFARERWGIVRVTGSAQHVMACMAHGKELGVDVVPLGDTGQEAFEVAVPCALVGFCLGMFFGMFFGAFFDDVTAGVLYGGFIGAYAFGSFGHFLIKKAEERDARQIGQQYRDIFPETYGSERRANHEAARRKGLL